MRYSIFVFLILVGCGQKRWTPEHRIDADLRPLVTEFVTAFGQPINPIVVEFGPTPLYAIGVCNRFGEQRAVWIDRDLWDRASDTVRRVTIFHELGHCVLNRDHTEPESFSIMNPGLDFAPSFYSENWNDFLNELFGVDSIDPNE